VFGRERDRGIGDEVALAAPARNLRLVDEKVAAARRAVAARPAAVRALRLLRAGCGRCCRLRADRKRRREQQAAGGDQHAGATARAASSSQGSWPTSVRNSCSSKARQVSVRTLPKPLIVSANFAIDSSSFASTIARKSHAPVVMKNCFTRTPINGPSPCLLRSKYSPAFWMSRAPCSVSRKWTTYVALGRLPPGDAFQAH